MARDGLTAKQRFWLENIESCGSSGVSMRAYAAQHGLDLQHFYSWKKQLKALGVLSEKGIQAGRSKGSVDRPQTCALNQRPAPFLRAAVIPAQAQPLSEGAGQEHSYSARISLANGITIEAPAGIAADALGALIVAAQQIATGKGGSRS